jgi:hypothetical protein
MQKLLKISLLLLVTISAINKINAQPISPHLFGINAWMPDSTGSRFLNGPLHRNWGLVKQSKGQSVRVGGISLDRDMPTNYQYIKMVDSIRAVGMEPIIQVSYWGGKYTAKQAADLVHFLNVTHKKNIKYWCIGNEPDHKGSYNFTSASQVAPYLRSFASAMKAVDPSIKTIGPDCAWYNRTMMDPLTTPGGPHDITGKDQHGRYYIDIISFHQYPFKGEQTRSQVISELMGPGKFKDRLAELNSRLVKCDSHHGRTGSNKLKVGVTEANIAYHNKSDDNIYGLGTNSFIGAQFNAEMMGIAMRQGVEFINFWGFTNALGMVDNYNGNKIRPSYYHFQMVAENFKGNFCRGTSNQANVKTFGSKNSEQIVVLIMNQSSGTNHNYTVRLDNATVSGSNSLKLSIDAGVAKEYSSTIQNQSTTLLIFDSFGNIVKKCEYKLVGHADKNLPPSCKNYPPEVTVKASGPVSFCEGGNVVLSTTNVQGYTYQWKRDGTDIQAAKSATFTATTSGDYTVEVSSLGGKTLSAVTKVSVENVISEIVAEGKTEICAGSNVKLNAKTGAGYKYQWRRNSVDIPGATSSSFSATTAGSYRVAVTVGACTKISDNIFITVADPVATVTYKGALEFCKGESVVLEVATKETYKYQWKRDNSHIIGAINSTYKATTEGNYSVEVTESGCSKTSEPLAVITKTLNVSTTAESSLTFCEGDSVILTVSSSAANSYQWKNNGQNIPNATQKMYIAKTQGNFSVTVTGNGCSETSSELGTLMREMPSGDIFYSGNTQLCNKGTLKLTAPEGEDYIYQWEKNQEALAGENFQSLTVNEPGFYSVKISNFCGSTDLSAIHISECDFTGIGSDEDAVFSLFPNPTSGHVTIEMIANNTFEEDVLVEVISMSGQVLKSFRANNFRNGDSIERLELESSYAEGTYLVRISSGPHAVTKKIILSR